MAANSTVGVTVGVGVPYSELAILASSCFTEFTGLPSLILGPSEFEGSGLSHPAALRLKLFDYVSADRVIYFDADWLCLGAWNPPISGENSDLLACRDFLLTDEWPDQYYEFDSVRFNDAPVDFTASNPRDRLRHEYIAEVQSFAELRLPCSRWINSGLLMMNRSHHKQLLDTALELYCDHPGHHRVYYEQPAMMKAIEYLSLPVQFLPRRLNVLAAYEHKWPSSVIGLHIKAKRHSAFLAKVHDGSVASPQQVHDHFIE